MCMAGEREREREREREGEGEREGVDRGWISRYMRQYHKFMGMARREGCAEQRWISYNQSLCAIRAKINEER